jgi:hypothetical protein
MPPTLKETENPICDQIFPLTVIYKKRFCNPVISKLLSLKDRILKIKGFYTYIYLIVYFSMNTSLLETAKSRVLNTSCLRDTAVPGYSTTKLRY